MKAFKFIIQALLISVFLAFFWFIFLLNDEFTGNSLLSKKSINSLLFESTWKGFSFAIPSILIFGYYHFKKKVTEK